MLLKRLEQLCVYLKNNTATLLKIVQIAALIWVGFGLQNLVEATYSTQGRYDDLVAAMQDIADKLDNFKDAIIYK